MSKKEVLNLLSKKALQKRAKRIRLFAMDVDGVLTEGSIILLESGEEIKFWNVKDRIAFFMLKKFGDKYPVAWITGRKSRQVESRAREVGVVSLHQHCEHKGLALDATLSEVKVQREETLFIGDDLVDLPALRRAGLAVCPSDAHPAVKKVCHWVTRAPGGRGVLREVVDFVLESQKLMKTLLDLYENPDGRAG
ncbi:MAG: HAD hydrolase family protein [Elusimicrobia bacterium]|nr:HAD hydrolase family protein [Elusimicrobiota bacterium]